MNRADEMKVIRKLIGLWLNEIVTDNAESYFDINKISEHLCRQLLNLIYGYELIDLNAIQKNFPGLDLGNKEQSRIAFQITSRTDRQKIMDNLQSVVDKKYHDIFSAGIKFLILNASGKVEFTKRTRLPNTILPTFDYNKDIIYPADLIKRIEEIYETEKDLIKFNEVKLLLEKELAPRFPNLVANQHQQNIDKLQVLLQNALHKINQKDTEGIEISSSFFESDLEIPVIKNIIEREVLVAYYSDILRNKISLWLHGPISTGKTSAIVSLSIKWPDSVFWIECRGIKSEQLLEHILSSLAKGFDTQLKMNFKASVYHLLDKLNSGSLIVLNDISQIDSSSNVQRHLSFLINQVLQSDSSIAVTSNFLPPDNFEDDLGLPIARELIQPFSEDDTKQLLTSMGATEDLGNALKKLITTATQGHPLLIKSAAKYLKNKDWELEPDDIVSIFTGKFDLGSDKVTYQKLIDETNDSQTRDLLYRLKYIVGSFDRNLVMAVAALSPEIRQSGERLFELTGNWIQENKEGRFQVSPLIKKLDDNVSPELKINIYETLAQSLLAKKNLSLIDASSVILYFTLANKNNSAAIILTKALNAIIKSPDLFFDWGLNMFWYSVELPADMAPFFKVQIRVAQITLSKEKSDEIGFLRADLERIISQDGSGEFEKFLANMLFFQLDLRSAPLVAFENLLKAKASAKKLEDFFSDGEPIFDQKLNNGIWLAFLELNSIEAYREWFNKFNISDYPPEIVDPNTNDVYIMAAVSIYRQLVVRYKDSGDAPQFLMQIIKISAVKELWLFAAYGIKYLVKYLIEDDDLKNALKAIEDFQWLLDKSPIYKFLVYAEAGRQLHIIGKEGLAFKYLGEIIDERLPVLYTEMLDFSMAVSQLYYKTDPDLARSSALKGLKLAVGNDIFLLEDRLKQYGEAAIGETLVGNYKEALYIIAEGYWQVLENFKENNDEYKALVIRFGHTAMYIVQGLDLGNPRDFGDGEKFVVPDPGTFYRDTDRLLKDDFYFDERRSMVSTIVTDGFEVARDKPNAKKWAYKTMDLVIAVKNGRFVPVVQKMIFYLIEDKEYRQAYNILAHIESFYNDLAGKVANGTSNVEEKELIERSVKVRALGDDMGVYLHILLPAAMGFSIGILKNHMGYENYQTEIDNLFYTDKYQVIDKAELQFAKSTFEKIMIGRITYDEMKDSIDELTTSNKDFIYAIGCILLSSFTLPQEAANLQLANIPILDLSFRKNLRSFYDFRVVPYFEEFWKIQITKNSGAFSEVDILKSQGLTLIEKAPLPARISKIYQVLSKHLNFYRNDQINKFIWPES